MYTYKIPQTAPAMTCTAGLSMQQYPLQVAKQELRACIGISGAIISASRSWLKLLGWSRTDLAEGAFVERVHPDDLDVVVAAIHQIYHSGAGATFTCRYARKDGVYVLIEWLAAPRRDVQYINLHGQVVERSER